MNVTVYDVIGQTVVELVDGEQPAGAHAVTWDAAGKGSGIYFCRFEVGGTVTFWRLVLVR